MKKMIYVLLSISFFLSDTFSSQLMKPMQLTNLIINPSLELELRPVDSSCGSVVSQLFNIECVYQYYWDGKPWDNERVQDWIAAKIDPSSGEIAYMVYYKNIPVGIFGWYKNEDEKSYSSQIALFPDFHRKGIAKALYRYFIQEIKLPLGVTVHPDNFASRELFKSLGFESDEHVVEIPEIGPRVYYRNYRD